MSREGGAMKSGTGGVAHLCSTLDTDTDGAFHIFRFPKTYRYRQKGAVPPQVTAV